MTRLEEEIISAFKGTTTGRIINVNGVGYSGAELDLAESAAEVAKKYIEKAVIDIMKEDYAMGGQELNEETMHELLNVWLKENGVIE